MSGPDKQEIGRLIRSRLLLYSHKPCILETSHRKLWFQNRLTRVSMMYPACRWVFYEDEADGTLGLDVAGYNFLEMQWHQARTHEV